MNSETSKPRPMLRSDLAALKGCTRANLSKLTKPGGLLAPARLPGDDGLFDANHECVRRWLAGKQPVVPIANATSDRLAELLESLVLAANRIADALEANK